MVVGVVMVQEEVGRGNKDMEGIEGEGGTPKIEVSLGRSKGSR